MRWTNKKELDKLRHIKSMLVKIKSRAKKTGIPFSLKPEDVDVPDRCPVLGIKLHWWRTPNISNSPSIDRINPKRWYNKNNIQVISAKANRAKNNLNQKELVHFAERILENKKN